MTEENPIQTQEKTASKTWNEQLKIWYKASGKSVIALAKDIGIPRSTFEEYIYGRMKNISRIKPDRLGKLYDYTKLECFKYEGSQSPRIPVPGEEDYGREDKNPGKNVGGRPKGSKNKPKETRIENISDLIRTGRIGIDRIVENIAVQLSAYETVRQGMLKSQRYKPSTEERADAIMETLDILAEEVDYFRTAPDDEKKILVDRLQADPQSFGYASQMLNIIYGGKKLDSWMLMAQPPSKIKRISGGK